MESLIPFFFGGILVLFMCLYENYKGKYLNKGWANKNPIQEDLPYSAVPPTFRIEKVERTRGCNDVCWVGKYTVKCQYRTKQSVDYSTIVFYDNLNKYKVGNILVLTPEIENN